MRRIAAGALAALVTLPSFAAGPKEDPAVAEFKQATLEVLKDPDSARFRSLRMTEGPKLDMRFRALCGEVNAKNGFGGYIGFQRFVTWRVANYDFKTVLEASSPGPTSFSSAWAEYCATR